MDCSNDIRHTISRIDMTNIMMKAVNEALEDLAEKFVNDLITRGWENAYFSRHGDEVIYDDEQ